MSQFNTDRAAALRYDGGQGAPVVVAAGSGYVAQKIVEVAQEKDVPIYEDNSLATLLSQLKCGVEIPPELFQAVVNIYVYFLNFNENKIREAQERAALEKAKQTPEIEPEQTEEV